MYPSDVMTTMTWVSQTGESEQNINTINTELPNRQMHSLCFSCLSYAETVDIKISYDLALK